MEYELDFDNECPNCKHSPIHYRTCTELDCEDGFVDASWDDPLNYQEGEVEYICGECKGTGIEIWCPKCGENLSGKNSSTNIENIED